ncbi:hypothetical protein [Marinilactibacillus sp. Marseille-P9653]|uniref:hypothetical protein n=1 Tax=Marinilactibacillus sp. Marseille-P9653 TaxID=2866583 RepID=UPI001CE3DAA6|nr:hypothetical protein [Marinilactibacillus sp. Marseille-P9653]
MYNQKKGSGNLIIRIGNRVFQEFQAKSGDVVTSNMSKHFKAFIVDEENHKKFLIDEEYEMIEDKYINDSDGVSIPAKGLYYIVSEASNNMPLRAADARLYEIKDS